MYAGKIVEQAPVRTLFSSPSHPYTIGLFESLPSVQQGRKRLRTIPGIVPAATQFPAGCRFHPRCVHAMSVCRTQEPPLESVGPEHRAACWLHDTAAMEREGRPCGIPPQAGGAG
jgi:peptide/nickel transport system ATP-binding protein